jgi:hypothetical protein
VPRLVIALLCAALGCRAPTDATRELGAPCDLDVECNERCLPAPRWPQGFCSKACAATADCPVGADCVTRDPDGAVCVFVCHDDRDCDFLESSLVEDAWACARDGERELRVCVPR